MDWVLVTVLAVLFFGTSCAALATLILRARFHRLHRVDPSVATDAPMTWLVDPRLPARLHRRLARVGTVATVVVDEHTAKGRRGRRADPTPLAVTARQVREHAVGLDLRVARLAVLTPSARRQPMAELVAAVAEVEVAAARLAGLSTQVSAPRRLAGADPVTEIGRQLDHLSAAHHELDDIDRAAGLHASTAAGSPTTPTDPTRFDTAATDPTRVMNPTVRAIARSLRRTATPLPPPLRVFPRRAGSAGSAGRLPPPPPPPSDTSQRTAG